MSTMVTSLDMIREWFLQGVARGATHMIVVCDSFDHDDYPVYVEHGQDPWAKANEYAGKDEQRVMEVYALHLDMDAQLAETRAFHYDAAPERVLH